VVVAELMTIFCCAEVTISRESSSVVCEMATSSLTCP